ncbi:MAG: M23 family metallopeptidase [Cyclobacteriaceae bacterium]
MQFKAVVLLAILLFNQQIEIRLPVDSDSIELTEIGDFGIIRKARPNIPAHHHTGIDIKRPNGNYQAEPIYTIADGEVISKRTDGPYAQLIIFHDLAIGPVWTVYEHIAEIEVELGELVTQDKPIARFFNRQELDQYGWQFDHFHFEILKSPPINIRPSEKLPDRHFRSYTLGCFDEEALLEHFYEPQKFLNGEWD